MQAETKNDGDIYVYIFTSTEGRIIYKVRLQEEICELSEDDVIATAKEKIKLYNALTNDFETLIKSENEKLRNLIMEIIKTYGTNKSPYKILRENEDLL